MADERFSFRWGIPWLDGGYTTIPNFMIRRYAEVGVNRSEFLVIIHLAAYRYESANGQASPSLETVARQMGYKDSETVRHHIRSLEAKGMLTRHLRAGDTSVYDLAGFSRKVLAAHLEADTLHTSMETPPHRYGDPLHTSMERRRKEEHDQQSDDGVLQELIQKLMALGIHESQANKWAAARPASMVQGWIEYVRRDGSGLSNIPGFLVAKLRDGEQPPAVDRKVEDNRRYIEGPYAHLVQH